MCLFWENRLFIIGIIIFCCKYALFGKWSSLKYFNLLPLSRYYQTFKVHGIVTHQYHLNRTMLFFWRYREMEGKRRRRGQGQKNVIPEKCRNGRIRNKNDNLRYRFNYNICEQVVARCRGLSSPNSNEAIYKSENISSEKDFEKGLESNSHNDNVSTTGLRLLQSYQVDDDIFEEESSRTNGKKIVDFLLFQSCCFYFLLDV